MKAAPRPGNPGAADLTVRKAERFPGGRLGKEADGRSPSAVWDPKKKEALLSEGLQEARLRSAQAPVRDVVNVMSPDTAVLPEASSDFTR